MTEPEEGPDGPLAMALSIVQAIRDDSKPGTGALEELIDLGVQVWGIDGLVRGFGGLIYIGVNLVKRKSDVGPVLQTLLPAALQWLGDEKDRLGIPKAALPIASALITAAYFDQMPNEWRTPIGPLIPGEPNIFCLTACLVVQFVDEYVYCEPGRFAEAMNIGFATDPI